MGRKNRLDSFHISPRFPGYEILLFGRAVSEEKGKPPREGYVSTLVGFPKSTDVLEISVNGTRLHETYVSSGNPIFKDASFLFEIPKAVAEVKLVHERLLEEDKDAFDIDGGYLLGLERKEIDEKIEQPCVALKMTNLFTQVLHFYSVFLSKRLSAMARRKEYRAARQTLAEMSYEMRQKKFDDPDRLDLQARISQGFKNLIVDILNEVN